MNWDSRFARYLVWIPVTVLTIPLIVSGGILFGLVSVEPITQATNIVPTSAALTRSVSAVVLIVTAFVYLRTDSSEVDVGTLVSQESPPETPGYAPRLTGAEFDSVVTDALREIQLKNTSYEETTPRQNLRETAQMAITVAFSCNKAKAEQMLNEGTWTDDSIAKGFLESDISYPVGFRFFRWGNPSQAYTVALDRTSQAIIELTNSAQDEADTRNHERDQTTGGLLSTLRADIEQKHVEAVSLGDKKRRVDSMQVPTEDRQSHYSGEHQVKDSEIDE
jgi:hypothetical protein